MAQSIDEKQQTRCPQRAQEHSAQTRAANRAAELATYLMACRNARIEPDPAYVAEHDQLATYAEVDPADDHLVIEAQVEPGTLGWTRGEREPATGTLIANGMVAVELTFRGDGFPTVVVENLHDDAMLVQVETRDNRQLFRGLIDAG
ncbi:hypothetical protein GCM10011374_36210 [Kocuria dechangensis]|uniref:Uncharacterized protein n=1 Tax=Kocuria dechangensis TaxID=1176249 RepID=A0A917H5W8_9MICC|nr:hypothetical protein [Kocuria dechangensis]GGG68595.1 hypothetical protein GCM10011374_36210 [Kocuria dechangensis]